MNATRMRMAVALAVALALLGCDLFESPTEPEDLTSESPSNDGVAGSCVTKSDNVLDCEVILDGAGWTRRCAVSTTFESSCSRPVYVSMKLAYYRGSSSLATSLCSIPGGSADHYAEAFGRLEPGDAATFDPCLRHLSVERIDEVADDLRWRWAACWTPPRPASCFADDSPP